MMENRCGNGLILLLYAAAASPAQMKNNSFIPGGRWPHMTPPPSLPLVPPTYSDSAGKTADDWAGSHLACVHLV